MGRRRRKKFKQFKQLKQFKFKFNPIVTWVGSFLFVFLALFGSLGYAVYTSSIFKVQLENIRSNVKLSQAIEKMVDGESLFTLDIKQVVNRISKENPEYKEVSILREFPSTLTIKVVKRIAYAQIKGRRFFSLDKEGVLIDEGFSEPLKNLIVVEVAKDTRIFRKGYQLRSKGLNYAFELIASLERGAFNFLKVRSINATQPQALYFMASLDGVFNVSSRTDKRIKIIVGKNDFSRKLALLEDVINIKFKDKLNLIRYVDLRYKEVYVGLDR